jgi:hypothetical protein
MAAPEGLFIKGPPTQLDRASVLLVEGTDDAFFFETILAQLRADPARVAIAIIGGKDNLTSELGAFIKSSAFVSGVIHSYAIIVDSDADPVASLRKVHAALGKYNQPKASVATIDATSQPKVGVYLIPSGTESGELETLALKTVDGAPVMPHLQTFLKEAQSISGNLDKIYKRSAQAFLAVQPGELCRGTGRGFSNGHFPLADPCLDDIKRFVTELIQ